MKHLIRSRETGHFYCDGAWTPDARLATDFGTTTEAAKCWAYEKLKRVDLVVVGKELSKDDNVACGGFL